MSTPTLDQLKRAIVISEQIETLQAELTALFGGQSVSVKTSAPKAEKKGKRTMSPEARERIAAAQRARWAKSKGESTPAAPAERKAKASKAKGTRVVSPEGRAKMAAAAKKRWAGKKAAK